MSTNLLREPLVHFLLIGALIFGLYQLKGGETDVRESLAINIESSDIEQLRKQWLQQTGGEADEQTLDKLIDGLIKEEVMFREALRLGLDKNDTIVRRRLVQKMEFLSANLSSLDLPQDDALHSYYEENSERYQVQERRSFTHVYFSRDRRGDSLLADAQVLLLKLQEGNPEKRMPEWGDNFILQYDYRAMRQQQVARIFGTTFAESLFSLEASTWQGPVLSEYGAHLVLIHEIIPAHLPTFADVRERVRDDYMQAELEALKNKRYKTLREQYSVNIDKTSS